MPPTEIERVSADLQTIRSAMGLDKTYAQDDVTRELVTAFSGVLVVLLLMFTQWDNRLAFAVGLLPGIVYYLRFTAQRRTDRADRPSLWQEEKATLQALAVVMPLLIGWLAWSRVGGPIDLKSAGAAALFFFGVGLAYVGIVDVNRRRYLPASVALIAFGLAFPALTSDQLALCAAAALIAGGLGAAAILQWQLNRDRANFAGAENS